MVVHGLILGRLTPVAFACCPLIDIVLEEVPSLLVLRDNWNQNAAGVGLDQACREPGSPTP